MNTPLTHDEAFAMLPELALGMLPADEAARVMEVVRTSVECQAELASLRATAGALASSAPSAPMNPARKSALRDRLVARAVASAASDATGSADSIAPVLDVPTVAVPTPASSPALRLDAPALKAVPNAVPTPAASEPTTAPKVRSIDSGRSSQAAASSSGAGRFVPWFAAAASLGFALMQFRANGALVAERDAAQVALKSATASTTQLASQLASSDSLVAAMTGAQVRVVELASTAKLPPGARMFWDRLTNRWTLITHDLTPAQAGRTYQLWLVTAKSEKISAGTFNTDAKGRAVVQATYALAEADLAAIAITEEPTGGSPQPTGTILVAGAPTR